MKKNTACFLAAVLVLIFSACGSSGSGTSNEGTVIYFLEADEEAEAQSDAEKIALQMMAANGNMVDFSA